MNRKRWTFVILGVVVVAACVFTLASGIFSPEPEPTPEPTAEPTPIPTPTPKFEST